MIRKCGWFVFLGMILLSWVGESFAKAPQLPVKVPEREWSPLNKKYDNELQTRLRKELYKKPAWRKLISSGKMAVGLVDMSSPANSRYAQVNGDVEMYAASLPKIAILLAAFDQIERGKLRMTEEVEQDLNDMIRFSNNAAATRMIDRLGGLMRVNDVLKHPHYRFYDSKTGGLWVGKRYAKEGPRVPDPLKGISHAATVDQVCRFYYLLATGRLVSPKASRTMLEMMSEPGIEHKFVKTLKERAPNADLYRKSGTWHGWHADSVLVWGPSWRRYILVGLVESEKGEQIMRDLVPVAEKVLRTRTYSMLETDGAK